MRKIIMAIIFFATSVFIAVASEPNTISYSPTGISTDSISAHIDGNAILNNDAYMSKDSISAVMEADTISEKRPNIFKRIINYFDDSNKPKEYKRFDWSIIGGPHYSSDTQFGIGLVAAGFYRHNMSDTLTRPSNVSLYGDISTVGFYMVGVRGTHIFTGEKNRINYNFYFYHFPREFWGIGYKQGIDMSNKSKFDETHLSAKIDYLHSLVPGLFMGPQLTFSYSRAAHIRRPELWEGLKHHPATYELGLVFQYDTRDNLTAPERGLLATVTQNFAPRFLFNKQAFSSTDLSFSIYRKVWKGGLIAGQYHTQLCYGDVPWASMATFGGSSTMRGYYDGRFRDKGEMDLTVELRQHVWRRNGIVVWGGMGTVYPKLSAIKMKHMLPNFGIGYRWEFKKQTNIRLDYGFGRGENSFIFSINEAF